MTGAAELALHRAASGALLLQLGGAWTLETSRPSPSVVTEELERRPATAVFFDSTGIEKWDSALLTFLIDVLRGCGERNVTVDQTGLPAGVRRLLALAAAVPERAGARGAATPPSWVGRVGLAVIGAWDGVVETLRFIGDLTLAFGRFATLRARFQGSELWLQMQQCGAQALGIVTLISFLVGLILAFMGAVQLQRFGATIYVADLVAIGVSREMGAVMTAVVMAGRTGAAFAAQLGTMKVTEEIDALTTFGLRPMEYLVLPRVVALLVMMPLLCVYADVVGLLGGLVVGAGMLDLTVLQYVEETKRALALDNLFLGVGKAAVFGVLIGIAGCLRGMQAGSSASSVGEAATRAVVTGIVLIIVTDGLFAVACNILGI